MACLSGVGLRLPGCHEFLSKLMENFSKLMENFSKLMENFSKLVEYW